MVKSGIPISRYNYKNTDHVKQLSVNNVRYRLSNDPV